MEASSSNSSNQNPRWKYHVFLSFGGEDIRNSFADHLFAALEQNGILTFKDDEELERGEVISLEFIKAIQESLFAIIILSPDYPSSSWCLDELDKILESRRVFGRQAFPVFYGVDPSHVRQQKGGFAEVFKRHEKKFGEDSSKVRKWKEALKEVANLSGWDCRNRRETELIEQIIQELCVKLQPFLPSHNDELVGIDSKMKEISSFLRLNEINDVHFIGICGMGGVGKTTLARFVYERIKNQFDGNCFLQDVREYFEREGPVELQRKLLSNLKVQGMEIKDSYDGTMIIRNTLCNRRILLILDDVNTINQLENLAGDRKWFGQGSRVIVTTRNKQLMKTYGITFKNYEVGLLDSDESLQLFFKKSFKGDQPKEEYLSLSKEVVQYAGGLPLALKVFGSFLYGRNIPEWKDTLDMLKQEPNDDILKTLRLSYDALEDTYKTIFLDIACFFNGWDRNHVTHILQICGRNPIIGIEVLIEKSLLTYDGRSLKMHDLLQDMGKYIVFHESTNDACGRSRIWSVEDLDHVLAKNKENNAIQGIVLNIFEPYERHWNLEAFSKMCNLKLLILRTSLHLSVRLNCLSNALRVLEWMEYPLTSLPPSIQLNNLVDLKMHHSKMKQLWSGIKFFPKLKFIDLSHCKYLTQTPDVSEVPCLESMVLKGCINLLEVHQSIGKHKKLVILSLEGCLNLKILPKKLEMNSLKNFILSGCSKVKKLPEFGNGMESLLMLDLKGCQNLLCLPNSIQNLKSLKILNIAGCSKFSKMPNNLNENEALEELDASGTAIREVPSSIVHLKNLHKLSFEGCKGSPSNNWDLTRPFRWFQKFPRQQNPMSLMLPCISQMTMLRELNLSFCNLDDGSIFDNLNNLSSLSHLNLSGNKFVDLPTYSIASLSKLHNLNVRHCARLQSLPILPSSLEKLYLYGCISMDFVSCSQHAFDVFASQNPNSKEHGFGFGDHFWIPGSEIPTWFDNQNYCCKDFLISAFPELYGEYHSIVSMIIDIPNHCRSSGYWGIAICLVLEYTSSSRSSFGLQASSDIRCWIRLTCKAPEADFSNKPFHLFSIGYLADESNYPPLFIKFLSRKLMERIKEDAACDEDPFELIFCSGYSNGDREKSKLKIRKCGYRLLWKDDVEMRSNALTETKGCQRHGVEEDDGAVSISNPPRPSKRAKLLWMSSNVHAFDAVQVDEQALKS